MEIRWLKPEEYAEAHALISTQAKWMAKPDSLLVGQFVDGKMVGVIGVTRPVVIEPLVVADGGDAEKLLFWMDGHLSPQSYFAFVPNEAFQHLIDKKYSDNVEGWSGKLYHRVR